MLINFETYYYNGANVIANNLTLAITTHYITGDITRTITLDASNTNENIELLDNNGIGIMTNFSYDVSTGILSLSNDMLLPNAELLLDAVISSTYDTATITLNIPLYDVILDAIIYIITDPIHVKASTMYIQKPLTNEMYFYNLTNSDITTCTIIDSQLGIISSSPTGVISSETSMILTTTYTYTYYNGTTFITVTDISENMFNHNTFLPSTDFAFTNNGYLYKGFPTINTIFEGVINSNYLTIQTLPQISRIMHINTTRLHITTVTGSNVIDKYKWLPVDNTTFNLQFIFDKIMQLVDTAYKVTLSNYIINGVAETPVDGTILISGNYYYIAAVNNATTISNNSHNISVLQGSVIYIDPSLFGVIGTSISFTGTNNMTVLPITLWQNAPRDNAYYIADGNMIIDNIVYNKNSTIFISNDNDIDLSSTGKLLMLTQEVFIDDTYDIQVYDGITIDHPECNTYNIYNNTLNTINIDIYKLIYTVDIQGEYEKINTVTISSGDIYSFKPNSDGVYKLDILDSNTPKQLYLVSICNVDKCIINYINDLVCCNNDSNCECNLQGHDCNYIDRSNFIAVSLLYDLLKNMIVDVIGINQIYTDTISNDALYLHSITDILARISNFCNNCE